MADEQTSSAPSQPSQLTEGIKEEDIILITESSTPNFSHTVYSLDSSSADPSLIYSYANPPQTLIWRYRLSELPIYLRLPAEDIHVIISTKSGAEKAVDFYETVLEPVLNVIGLSEKKEYSILKTESHESISQFAQGRLRERAAKGVQQTVVLLAGDGGVVDLVNGLMRVMGPVARYGLIFLSFYSRFLVICLQRCTSQLQGLCICSYFRLKGLLLQKRFLKASSSPNSLPTLSLSLLSILLSCAKCRRFQVSYHQQHIRPPHHNPISPWHRQRPFPLPTPTQTLLITRNFPAS